MSPSKRESEKKKRRREEKQISFEEGNIRSDDDIRREDSELKGNIDSKASDSAMSPPKGESQKKKRGREGKQVTFEEEKIGSEDDIRREESELNGNIDNKASDSTLSPSKGESEKKKRRREGKQITFEEEKIGSEDDIRREGSELNGNVDNKASDSSLSPSKGESQKKKRRREGKQITFEEEKIGSEDDIRREGSELNGNVDNKASDSSLSPSKGESQKKKRRREGKQITFEEGKIGSEDDIRREGSELNGNIDSKASDSSLSPAKGESEKKKRRREGKQITFEEGKIGSEDDIRREGSELNGNIDSKASDSTLSPPKGESQKKKRRREEKQNSFDEGKIGREDDISREESELNGDMDSKASDLSMTASEGGSKKKKRRRQEKQNSFDDGKFCREDDIGREESEPNGNIGCISTVTASKRESKRKKKRREEKQNGFEEGKIGGEDANVKEESKSKVNIDSKDFDSTMSPVKGDSKRKKRRREEKHNSLDDGKICREDDIGREEIESKGNIHCNASNSAMSPAKGESKRKKRRREEKQNNFDERKIGREDDISREESELKGNMDSKASDSTMAPSKGKSKKKRKRREEKQNSLEEGKIGREDDMSKEESELQGNVENKASDSTMSPSKGEVKRRKTVRFQEPAKSDADERNWKKDLVSSDLRYGKFTTDEDEKIKIGVSDYIKMRGWDEKEGLQKVLHVALHRDARGCWLEIAKCLPYRPVKQINARALRLLDRPKRGKWSAEELEELENLHNQYGNAWTKISSFMDRTAQVCKDRWRHLKLVPTRKEGSWSQDEYDELCKLVRQSLRVKASKAAKTLDRREVREDINWEWIAEELQRDSSRCAEAWYHRLASPMVSATMWANEDDHLLLQRLREVGVASEETVDWDTILDRRDGELCMKRWQEMTRGLGKSGKSGHLSFDGKIELLAHRFAPHLLGIEEEE